MKKTGKHSKEHKTPPAPAPAPAGLAGQILEELKQLNVKVDRLTAARPRRGAERPRGERNIFGEEEE